MSQLTDSMKPQVDVVKPNWDDLAPSCVKAFFSCRTGGVSSGPWGGPEGFQGLNLSNKTGDYARSVEMNRSILSSMCPSEPRWITQVHGVEMVRADDVDSEAVQADAVYTTTPGVVCCVMTADCLPVLITEKKGRIAAAVHAGWRGLADGVVSKSVEELRKILGDDSAEWVAWLGPRIGSEDFEIGSDVVDAFRVRFADVVDRYINPHGNGKYLCDMGRIAAFALMRAGVKKENIRDCRLSTYADPSSFYSYRRDGAASGRHAACIWIEEQKK